MTAVDEIPLAGPHGAPYHVELGYAGEVRFGPAYFTVALNGRRLRRWWFSRYFAGEYRWSSDWCYLALAEWLVRSEPPRAELRIIDVTNRREVGFGRSLRGFLSPLRWEGSRLVFSAPASKAGASETVEESVDVR